MIGLTWAFGDRRRRRRDQVKIIYNSEYLFKLASVCGGTNVEVFLVQMLICSEYKFLGVLSTNVGGVRSKKSRVFFVQMLGCS